MNPSDQTHNGGKGQHGFRLGFLLAAALVVGVLLALALIERPAPDSLPEAPPPPATVIDVAAVRPAAESGDAEAQRQLGLACARGLGVPQNYAEAAQWYRRAAEQGNAAAQAALGELYEAGQGVPYDEAEAAKWYRRAAEQGHPGGQYSLAVLYVLGRGVPRDLAEALRWYRRAADQGDAQAQYHLGTRYRDGDGLPLDWVEAHKWLSLAAAQGLPDAVRARDELQRRMTREQIAESRRRVAAFSPVAPARESAGGTPSPPTPQQGSETAR